MCSLDIDYVIDVLGIAYISVMTFVVFLEGS